MPTLQWGHAFVSVETEGARIAAWRYRAASMGPRFCKCGNRLTRNAPARTTTASMGPRFCKRGNRQGHQRATRGANRASMGPRFCKRGNLAGVLQGIAFDDVASMGPRFCKRGNGISHRGASIPPFLAPAARSGATSAYFGRLGRDFAGHFPARRASSPL